MGVPMCNYYSYSLPLLHPYIHIDSTSIESVNLQSHSHNSATMITLSLKFPGIIEVPPEERMLYLEVSSDVESRELMVC